MGGKSRQKIEGNTGALNTTINQLDLIKLLGIKITICHIKQSPGGMNARLDTLEEKPGDLEDTARANIQN